MFIASKAIDLEAIWKNIKKKKTQQILESLEDKVGEIWKAGKKETRWNIVEKDPGV